jgi:hypothetical protein
MMDWEFRCDRDRTRDVYIFWLSRVIPILESQGKSLSIWLAPSMRTKYTRRVFGAYLWEQWVKLCVSTGSGWSNVFSCVCQCQSNHEPGTIMHDERVVMGTVFLWGESKGAEWKGTSEYCMSERASFLYLLKCTHHGCSLSLFDMVLDCACVTLSVVHRHERCVLCFLLDCCYIVLFNAKMIDLVAHFLSLSFFCFINGRKTLLATKGKM